MRWLRTHGLRVAVTVGVLLPLLWLVWSLWRGRFVIDPVRQSTTLTGRTALTLLWLSLACTPVHILTGWMEAQQVRRTLGLYAFKYAALHAAIFAAWDYGLKWDLLGPALISQRFILVGLIALVLLAALAVTSTRGSQARLGGGWRWLHRLVYLAAVLVAAHVVWQKKDWREALLPCVVLALLLIVRVPPLRRAIEWCRRR